MNNDIANDTVVVIKVVWHSRPEKNRATQLDIITHEVALCLTKSWQSTLALDSPPQKRLKEAGVGGSILGWPLYGVVYFSTKKLYTYRQGFFLL
jgi:hypothetical protein